MAVHGDDTLKIIYILYPDPSEVFDTILNDERILDRANSVTRAYDEFINEAHQWHQSNLWKDGWENSQAKDFELHELK